MKVFQAILIAIAIVFFIIFETIMLTDGITHHMQYRACEWQLASHPGHDAHEFTECDYLRRK